ncbi:MAG TPA: methyltransferase domain-containing protein [Lapillicoccus sp.]|nr:methyltransferase domain-containing protein [Lapillicoccus sp.]
MLVTSRSFAEYLAFFALDPDRLPRRVLDCSAGTSGFVAAARDQGCDAVAVDPAYRLPVEGLERDARAGGTGAAALVTEHRDRFTYDWYGTPERQRGLRADALDAFLADRRAHPGRYVAAALPQLPFGDGAFDVALCSHLLFTWAEVYDEAWHVAALREMARVAREVRVFPLLHQGAGEPVAFLPALRRGLAASGLVTRVQKVRYAFQVGGDEMLVVVPSP